MMTPPPPDPVYILRGNMRGVSCVAYGPNDTLFAGTEEGYLHLWDLMVNRERSSFQVESSTCLSVKIVHNSVITQGKGGHLTVWTYTGGTILKEFEVESSYIGFCKVDLHQEEDNPCLFIPCEDSKIQVFFLKLKEVKYSLQNVTLKLGEVMGMKYIEISNSPLLLALYESGHIILWDLSTQTSISELKVDGTPMAIDFDNVSSKGICGTESENIIVFEIDSNKSLVLKKSISIVNPGVSCISIRPDKKLVAVGCWDGRVRLFSWKTLRLLATLSEHKETVQDISFSPEPVAAWNTKYLMAVGSKDKSVSLWNVYN